MCDLFTSEYKKYRELIVELHNKQSWEQIKSCEICMRNENAENINDLFLKLSRKFRSKVINLEIWQALVDCEKILSDKLMFTRDQSETGILGKDSTSELYLPTNPHSAWQLYRQHLIEDEHWNKETVDLMQDTTFRILKKMSLTTDYTEPIKGLVVGNVQSGKTANMAALMAMAADNGWNLFIIFSGVIDKLREQTQTRLLNDLKNGNIKWEGLEKISVSKTGLKLFENNKCYINVCLKNIVRLKNLIEWLNNNPIQQHKMKILIIDDEADQASINTKDMSKEDLEKEEKDRTVINKLLVNLVNGFDAENHVTPNHFSCMNYVGYTATPYANVLNELPDNDNGKNLFPSNFIASLPVAKEYFGPQQIFGCEESDEFSGLDIINIIPEIPRKNKKAEKLKDDVDLIKEIHKGISEEIPSSLKDALAWFICCIAVQRYRKSKAPSDKKDSFNKPYSLLIHTSAKIKEHDNMGKTIFEYINNYKAELFDFCKKVWEKQTNKLSLELFKQEYPNYGKYEDYCLSDEIEDYPAFNDIEEFIKDLLHDDVSHIIMEAEHPKYSTGINLCIDNCSHNRITDECEHIRILYPDKKKDEPNYLDYPSAFIVIGGATLARGLTIEGLVSSYFLRTVGQSDTLMQMGRWFGYRRGYELLPRLWMDSTSLEKFKFLSKLDLDLRRQIKTMEKLDLQPTEYALRVRTHPDNLIRIASANRIQAARNADWNFSGKCNQTIHFRNDREELKKNEDLTKDFLKSLGLPITPKECNKQALSSNVWTNIKNDVVTDYLKNFLFSSKNSFFDMKDEFITWAEKNTASGNLKNWNIVLAGISGEKDWTVTKEISVSRVNRTKFKNPDSEEINIGVLRNPSDFYCDVDISMLQDQKLIEYVKKGTTTFSIFDATGNEIKVDYNYIRNKAGLSQVPLLILYVIDKDSTTSKDTRNSKKERENLNALNDIIGICIQIPGDSIGKNSFESVSLPLHVINEEEE